jgi:hypothetical protein
MLGAPGALLKNLQICKMSITCGAFDTVHLQGLQKAAPTVTVLQDKSYHNHLTQPPCSTCPMACRSMRLGYNVLLVDSDTAVFDDPYKYFKQPPFQDIVVLNQEESPVEANGGNLYVQVQIINIMCISH